MRVARILYFNPENPQQVTHLHVGGFKAVIWDNEFLEQTVVQILTERFKPEDFPGDVVYLADLLLDEEEDDVDEETEIGCSQCDYNLVVGFWTGIFLASLIAFMLWAGIPQFVIRHVIVEPARSAYFHWNTSNDPKLHMGDRIFLLSDQEVMRGFRANYVRANGRGELWTTADFRMLQTYRQVQDGHFVVLGEGIDPTNGGTIVYVMNEGDTVPHEVIPQSSETATPAPTDSTYTANPPAFTNRIKVIKMENWSSNNSFDIYNVHNTDGTVLDHIKLHIVKDDDFELRGQWVRFVKLTARGDHYDLHIAQSEFSHNVREFSPLGFMRVCTSLMGEPVRIYPDFEHNGMYTVEDSSGNLYYGNMSVAGLDRSNYDTPLRIRSCSRSEDMEVR